MQMISVIVTLSFMEGRGGGESRAKDLNILLQKFCKLQCLFFTNVFYTCIFLLKLTFFVGYCWQAKVE